MFDEIKQLFRAAMKTFGERIAPIEDDMTEVKQDIADLKAFRDELKGSGLDDLKAEIDAFAAKAPTAAPPAAGTHSDPDMAAAGLPGGLPAAA